MKKRKRVGAADSVREMPKAKIRGQFFAGCPVGHQDY
jgi:hypothetical protein